MALQFPASSPKFSLIPITPTTNIFAQNLVNSRKCVVCDLSASSFLQISTANCGHDSCTNCILKRFKEGKFECFKCSQKSENVYQFRCSMCKKSDSEENLNICQTCHPSINSKSELILSALCSTCALRKHKSHEIIEFFPHLSAFQYEIHLKNLTKKAEEFSKTGEKYRETCEHFQNAQENAQKVYESLIDFVRRAKNSEKQLEMTEKIKNFMEKWKNTNVELEKLIGSKVEIVENMKTKMEKELENGKKNVVELEEIVTLSKEVIENLVVPSFPARFTFKKSSDMRRRAIRK